MNIKLLTYDNTYKLLKNDYEYRSCDDVRLLDLYPKTKYIDNYAMNSHTIKTLSEYSLDSEILELNQQNIVGLLDLIQYNKIVKLDCSFNKIMKI